ncbi:importin-4-like [Pseudonaja textilis]|uniref:importin-4-like n=1 Tax=Pseudonaja textilis TaxID=8673 RepID=UPI000EA939BD|nr:importin-4-like [Pseudonaja textilis]
MCVRSVFMDEKEDACIALGEIAVSVSMPFLPYIETSFQEVSQLLPCPQIQIRKAAFRALGQLIISLHQVCKQEPSEVHVAVQGLEGASSSFVCHLLPALLGAAHDKDQEVCSNAVFGLGVLVEHSREAMFEHYPQILALLSNLISQEKNNRVIDNVCGAIARMIMANPGRMPIEQVFPVLLRALPLREDFEEYKTIYRCITFIYENDPSQVLQKIPEIVRSSGSVLGCKNLSTEARNLLITLLASLSARYPAEFQTAILANRPEVGTSIRAAIGSA